MTVTIQYGTFLLDDNFAIIDVLVATRNAILNRDEEGYFNLYYPETLTQYWKKIVRRSWITGDYFDSRTTRPDWIQPMRDTTSKRQNNIDFILVN